MSRRFPLLTLLMTAVLSAGGCVQTRIVTISTVPADATIKIDGIDRGRAPIVDERFVFETPEQTHRVVASRVGFKDAQEVITREAIADKITMELKQESAQVTILVEPVPGLVRVDGRLLSNEPVRMLTYELPYGVDVNNNPIRRIITAERPNFRPARIEATRYDPDTRYRLTMLPLEKKISVTTEPPGAEVFIGEKRLGISPVVEASVEFPVIADTNEFVEQKLIARKPGYDPTEKSISWDGGATDYKIDLAIKTKLVRILTDPPEAVVTIDGATMRRTSSTVAIQELQFPPANENGELKIFTVNVSKKTEESEWEPRVIKIGWDDGQTDYPVKLNEILTLPGKLLSPAVRRTDAGWTIVPEWTETIAMRNPGEVAPRRQPQSITKLAKGTQIGSIVVSPDGSRVLFTMLSSAVAGDFRSQMWVMNSSGNGAAEFISDGRSLDIMPSYTPGGDQIVFASNRGGRRMNIWTMSAAAASSVTRLTSGDSNDLWPSIDSDPRPRLFYQAMVDTRSDPRLYITQIGTIFQTDLTTLGGTQPRIGPKNDSILFSAVNDKTNKRDIYRISDRGAALENLTNTPDVDEFDATWSKDGRTILFASDQGAVDGRHNYDIWMLDLAKPDQPVQITANGSWDDCPAFDPAGSNVYFRSNRGGEWGIWKLPLK